MGRGEYNTEFACNKLIVFNAAENAIYAERPLPDKIVDLKVVGDWVVVGLPTEVLVFYFDNF